jgi:glyoxylase-like metal-dependent hydrolase (beta-lactamase superfamily II)
MSASPAATPWGTPVPRDPAAARASQLADGIWRLRLPLPYSGVTAVNAYLLAMADGWCLVDCGSGMAPGWESLAVALGQAGYAPGDVRVLLATHSHSDHFGLAAQLVRETGCELWMAPGPAVASDPMRDPVIPVAERCAVARRAGVPDDRLEDATGALDGGDGHHDRPEPTRRVRDGDAIEAAPGRWHVVDATGHGPNQIVLHAPATGWVISADLALEDGLTYLEHGYGGDPVAAHLEALARIQALRPTRLLPGHGRPIDAPDAVLAASARTVHALVDEVAALLGDEPRTPYDLTLAVVGGHDAGIQMVQSALSTVLCVLDHLGATGRARTVASSDGVRREVRR